MKVCANCGKKNTSKTVKALRIQKGHGKIKDFFIGECECGNTLTFQQNEVPRDILKKYALI